MEQEQWRETKMMEKTGIHSGNTNFSKREYWLLSVKLATSAGFNNLWLIADFTDSDNHVIARAYSPFMNTQEMWLNFVVYMGLHPARIHRSSVYTPAMSPRTPRP